MTRRPAVTLMEVLIAMFIMAIGMMALMVLFPVGAVSMGQALKDDRCAYASIVSENTAIVSNIRYGDSYVTTALTLQTLGTSQSGLVYVDPYGVFGMPTIAPYGITVGGIANGIPRVAPSFVYPQPPMLPAPVPGTTPLLPLIDRWFSLQDDISYNLSGSPDISNTGGIVDRGRRYSFAYLLRRQLTNQTTPTPFAGFTNMSQMPVNLYAVVYSGRPVNSLATTTTEWPLFLNPPVTPMVGVVTNSVTLNNIGLQGLKRGGWVLDPTNGYFYRVTNIVENLLTVPPTTTVEFQQNLRGNPNLPIAQQVITQIIGMDYVAEVFDKGFGWQQ